MKVRKLKYNWRQVGSIADGAGEDYDSYTVGENDITSIEENEPHDGLQKWNFVIYKNGKAAFRVFNPNFVEYFSE